MVSAAALARGSVPRQPGALQCVDVAVTDLNWQTIARTSMHPLAVRILEHAAAKPDEKFSPTEVADHFGAPLGNVSYHIRALHKAKLLDRAGTQPRRGAVQHFYRVADRALT